MIVGNTEPKGQGSFGLNASYKNFSLFASFMYEFGGQEYNSTLVSKVENADIQYSNVDKRVLTDRWQKPGKYCLLPETVQCLQEHKKAQNNSAYEVC